jgi:hypothetical protein
MLRQDYHTLGGRPINSRPKGGPAGWLTFRHLAENSRQCTIWAICVLASTLAAGIPGDIGRDSHD